jgi:beta-lactamase class A
MNHPATPPRCNYYVIGESRTNADNAITSIYGSFYMAFEVDSETETVLRFGCTHTLELTEQFLQDMFVGQSFPGIDAWLDNTLKRYYGGSSRRAVLTSYRDALKRYHTMKGGSAVV